MAFIPKVTIRLVGSGILQNSLCFASDSPHNITDPGLLPAGKVIVNNTYSRLASDYYSKATSAWITTMNLTTSGRWRLKRSVNDQSGVLKAQMAYGRRLYGRGSLALEESKEGCRRCAVEQEGQTKGVG